MGAQAQWTPSQARDAAIAIVRRLRDHGHVAYLAGGCVRDLLLGHPPTDFDVATDAHPERIGELFERSSEVGESFGVTLVRTGRVVVEVATFRSDGPYSDQRRPDHVEYAGEVEDAHRRDFTINALFLAPDEGDPPGRIIDHVGGIEDMRARVVRAVGDPGARLREDHLRALRAVRFACRLGFEIEAGTRRAIKEDAASLAGVSRERIGDELRRMLRHPSRASAASEIQALGLDGPVLGDRRPDAGVRALGALGGDEVAVWVSLGAWALDRGAAHSGADVAGLVRFWRDRLLLSNEERDGLRRCLAGVFDIRRDWEAMSVARRKRLLSEAGFGCVESLLRASDPALSAVVSRARAELAETPSGLAPEPLMTGDDLVAMGLTPGPEFARVLDATYDEQLEDRVRDKNEAALFVRSLTGPDSSGNHEG